MSSLMIGSVEFSEDDAEAHVELQAIREDPNNDTDASNVQDPVNLAASSDTEVIYDFEQAKAQAQAEQLQQSALNVSTYSWLPPEEPPKSSAEPLEIAGPPQILREAPKGGLLLTSVDSFAVDWAYTLLIGILVVSFWRGGWVFFDVLSCDQPPEAGMLNGDSFCFLGSAGTVHDKRLQTAVQALIAGYLFLGTGWTLLNLGLWHPTKLFVQDAPNNLRLHKRILRVLILLFLGEGTLCLWRGIWYLLDYYVHPEDATLSAGLTTLIGGLLCMCLCSTASLLAPPAIFLMDGPAHLPPPIGVTIVTSYRSIAYPADVAPLKNKADPLWLVLADVVLSYLVLPIGVVGFWRGMWALLDTWLWGFTDRQADINNSILFSFLLGLGLLFISSEDVVQHFNPEDSFASPTAIMLADQIFGRIRTLVLAFGTVNFWRAVWLFWDEFLGHSHLWSCLLSHFLGIFGLVTLGCLSCITAPPSTLGVDAVAHPEAADEPLFHNCPVPAEALYLWAIIRRPEAILKGLKDMPDRMMDPTCLKDRKERVLINQQSVRQMPPEVLSSIDSLLVQDEPMFARPTPQSNTSRLQTAAAIQSAARGESCSNLRLCERHMLKRQKSKFFRSR